MDKYMRGLLVGFVIVLGATGCDRGRAERERLEGDRTQETETTGAKTKSAAEELAKTKADHSETRTKLLQKFEAEERKASHLKQKAAKAVGKEKLNANAAIAELDARRATAKTSLGRLSDEASPVWDSVKKSAEDDVDSFERAVETLEQTISKK